MPDSLLQILKVCLLAVMFLFFLLGLTSIALAPIVKQVTPEPLL